MRAATVSDSTASAKAALSGINSRTRGGTPARRVRRGGALSDVSGDNHVFCDTGLDEAQSQNLPSVDPWMRGRQMTRLRAEEMRAFLSARGWRQVESAIGLKGHLCDGILNASFGLLM